MEVQTKFEQVYDYLINKIEREMAVAEKLPTEVELANLLNVNRMTVAKVMSVLKAHGYIERRQGIGTTVIRKPKGNVKDTIITVLPYVSAARMKDEYFSELFNAICLTALSRGLANVCVGSKEDQEVFDFERISSLHSAERHQGIIMMSPRKQGFDKWGDHLKSLNAAVVWVAMSINVSDESNCIDSDNIEGAIDATQYLFELGYRKVGFLSRELDTTNREDRLHGFEKAHKDYGIDLERNRIVIVNRPKSSREAGYKGIKALIEKGVEVDALFVADQGLLYGIEEARKEHPDEDIFGLPIVTFDYELPGRFSSVIASVIQPIAKMGKLAVEALSEIHEGSMKQPAKKLLKTELVKKQGVFSGVKL